MFSFSKLRKWASGRPILGAALAFFVVVAVGVTLSVWWNVLLVQQHEILKHVDQVALQMAAQPTSQQRVPFALLMFIGIGLSIIAVLGLVYLFLRLIQTLRLNLAQSQFIASVTHELRSPVAGIQVLFDTLMQPGIPEEKRKQFETSIRKELKRLRDLVDQVLDTARLEHSITKISLEPINLTSFLAETIEPYEALAKSMGGSIRIANEIPDVESRRVLAHRKLLGMVLSNLLDNAVKYSVGAPDITVYASEEGKWARLEVSDRGIGLTRPDQKKVFRRFFRAQDPLTQTKHGTGLGLYFTRLAINAQGGKIEARSYGPGHGTTFSFQVRLLRDSAK